MSKVFDTLRRVTQIRAEAGFGKPGDAQAAAQPFTWPEPCTYVPIPVFVYGYTAGDLPFHEETRTIAINERGGLIALRTAVQPGQRLVLTNQGNEWTQECTVVFVAPCGTAGVEVVIEFPSPTPQFWRNLEIGRTTDPVGA